MLNKLWREIKRLFRYNKLKGVHITSQTKPAEKVSTADKIYDVLCVDGDDPNMTRGEFRGEFAGLTDTSMHRGMNEAMEMNWDMQLSRAASFGRDHRNSRGKQ